METTLYDVKGTETGKIQLPEEVFSQKISRTVLFEVVHGILANRRAGTHSTKTRAEVSGGGKKPWKQKHTGRARAGSIRSPLWRGGGIIFGPHPRSYRQNISTAVKRKALKGALSAVVKENRFKVLNEISIPEAKTRQVVQILKDNKVTQGKRLLVVDKVQSDLRRAGRNIPNLLICPANEINAYNVLWADTVLFTQAAITAIGQRLVTQ